MELKFSHAVFLIVAIGAIWLETTAAQQNQLIPGQMFPPGQMCPDLMCTLEFIPEECREIPSVQINGNNCTGCPRRKSSCDKTFNIATNIPCPVLSCPELAVSKECQIVEPYEYKGRKCSSCPKIRPGCTGAASRATSVACPPQACPLIFIPTECKEVPMLVVMGQKCEGCPKWKEGCVPGSPDASNVFQARPVSPILEVSCPMVACDSYVPLECQVKNEFQFRGKLCQSCPTWKEGCRESERRAHVANPSIGRVFQANPVSCPVFPCPSVNIPPQCLEQQPFEYQGKTCYRCPRVKEGCAQNLNGFQGRSPDIPCPLISCQDLNVPAYCLQQEMYQFNGRMCHRCPTVKAECRVLASQTRPVTDLTRQQQPQTQCPSRRCPLIRIPQECMEIETFQFEGKTCEGCPRFRPGCVPLVNREIPVNPQPNESILAPIPEVRVECPLVACPRIYIPQECKQEQPYQFQGKTCYGCPKRKDNCSAGTLNENSSNPTNIPETDCPLLKCNRMLIPPECRDIQSYEFQGRTCYACPKFREGCVPGGNANGLLITNKLANLTPAEPVVKPLDIAPTATPEMACPLIRCQDLNLPQECLEPQTYPFMGKTCFNCPKPKPECAKYQNTKSIEKVCPVPDCPTINVPSECVETPTYQVSGFTCQRCPRRRDGCRGKNELSQIQLEGNRQETNVACPLMECGDNLIPPACIERQPYQFQGQTCYKCPTRRAGCTLNVPQSQPQSKDTFYESAGNPPSGSVSQTSKPLEVVTAAPSITNLRGMIPVERFISAIKASLCPRLPCPAVGIPPPCRERNTYMFNGISCPGCPTWKRGCGTGRPGQPNLNMNGILSYSFFNELMTRR